MAQEVVYGSINTNLIWLTFPKISKDANHVNQDEVVPYKSVPYWMCFNFELFGIALHLWGLSRDGSIKAQETNPVSWGTFARVQGQKRMAVQGILPFYRHFQIMLIFFPIAMWHRRLLSIVPFSRFTQLLLPIHTACSRRYSHQTLQEV